MVKEAKGRRGRPKNGGQRREEVLSALEYMFLQGGFRSHTVDGLSNKLSCSKRTLYNIAPSKEELFLFVMDSWLQRIRRAGWQGALSSTSPRKRIEEFLQPGITETANTTQTFWADVESYLPAKKMLAMHQRERIHSLEDMIQEGIDDGSFHSVHPYLIAEVLLSAILRFDSPEFLKSSGLKMSEAFRELYDVVFRGIEK